MLKTKQKIALASLAQTVVMTARQLVGQGAETRAKRSGILWNLDLREGIDFSIWLLGSFEPDTVRCYRRMVKSGDVVLDIGANIGAHTLPLAEAVGVTGKVYAFEPTDYAFGKLSSNTALNPELQKRIVGLQCMLVDQAVAGKPTPGLYSSWPLKNEPELHQLHQGRRMATVGASADTLDAMVRSLGIDRVDCVKLDIDGFECGMLRGAKNVLGRWHPPIVMELAPYALREQGESLQGLIELLVGLDYALFDLATGACIELDARALETRIPAGASLNVVARSAQRPA